MVDQQVMQLLKNYYGRNFGSSNYGFSGFSFLLLQRGQMIEAEPNSFRIQWLGKGAALILQQGAHEQVWDLKRQQTWWAKS